MQFSYEQQVIERLYVDLLDVNPLLKTDDIRYCSESNSLDLSFSNVVDISPLVKYSLCEIDLTCTRVKSLPTFLDDFLISLDLEGTDVDSLSNLAGQRLEHLNIRNTMVSSLAPLSGMNLTYLDISNTFVKDLTPLVGMPLKQFFASHTSVDDIFPIYNCHLQDVYLSDTKVRDISGLSLLELKTLYIINTPVSSDNLCAFKQTSKSTFVCTDIPCLTKQRLPNKLRILLAEDDPTSLNLYSLYLSRLGHNVTPVSTGMELMRKALVQSFDIIVSDVIMPSGYGDDIVQILREKGNNTPVILITGFSHSKNAESLDAILLQKPFELDILAATIRQVLLKREIVFQEQ